MRHLDLYSGIGGFALACQWAGIETIGFVEIDKFCQKVLRKHWPNVPIVEDVHDIEAIKGVVEIALSHGCRIGADGKDGAGVREQRNAGTGDGNGLLVTAGFPCQPFSHAGRRQGANDDRYLWPATLAVITATRPEWVLLENVPGILSMVFPDSAAPVASQASFCEVPNDEIADYDTIIGGIDRDLRQAGYETVWLVIPAASVGAPHLRNRVWIVAHDSRNLRQSGSTQQEQWRMADQDQQDVRRANANDPKSGGRRLLHPSNIRPKSRKVNAPSDPDSHAADAGHQGLEIGPVQQDGRGTIRQEREAFGPDNRISGWQEDWYEVATRFCRIPYGFPSWLDENWRRVNGQTSKTVTRQDVSDMWDYFQSGEVQRSIGELSPVLTKDNLFAVLRKLKAESEGQDHIPFESASIEEELLRELPEYRELGCTPQGWQYHEQSTREHSHTLPPLPHEIALATETLVNWYEAESDTSNRVARLKALGNAIVPQVAYEIIKALAESQSVVERGADHGM